MPARSTTLALLVPLMVVLVACSDPSEDPNGTPGAPIEVTFWHAFGDEARSGWIDEQVAAFNAELQAQDRDASVVAESRGGGYRGILQDAVQAADGDDPPHLVQLFEIGSQLAVDAGIFTPIEEVGGFDVERYIEPILNYYTVDDMVQAIPFNASSPILYANEAMLAEAGLDAGALPETFGELASACEAIDASGLAASCIAFPLHGWLFEQWIAEQGALLANNGNGREARATEVLLDGEPAGRIGRFMADLAAGGWYAYTGTLEDWGGSTATFTDQDAVFLISTSADVADVVGSAAGAGFDVATGLLPIPDGVTRNGVVVGGAGIWLTAGHTQAEAELARDFAQFLTRAEAMVAWHKLTGYMPVVDEAVTLLEAEGWFDDQPAYAAGFEQLTDTTPNQATAGALLGSFLSLRTTVEEALEAIYEGTATVEEALSQAKSDADADLAAYNSAVQP